MSIQSHFFFQFQINDCFLFVIFDDFFIDLNDIHVVMQQSFYVLQFQKSIVCVIINFDVLQMWHERFKHVNKTIIIVMIQKIDIDFSNFFSNDFCISCDKIVDKIEFYKIFIEFDRWVENFIHDDFMSFFFIDYNKIRWIICWLNDKIQMSYVTIFYFKKTFEIMKIFKIFFDIIKHDFNRYIRIRIDNEFEFINNKFLIFF